VVLSKNGRFYQREAYVRCNEIYAKDGSGFLGLRMNGTSVLKTNLFDYDIGNKLKLAFTATGRMVTRAHPKAAYYCYGVKSEEVDRKKLPKKRKPRAKKA